MDAATCWQSVSFKLLRSSSLPIRFSPENEVLYVRSSLDSKQIQRSRSASFYCQIVEEIPIRRCFLNQLMHSSEYTTRSYEIRKLPSVVGKTGAKNNFWHSIAASASSENEDCCSGICRSSFSDNWEESANGIAEEVACLNEKSAEDEMLFRSGKIIVDSSPGKRHSSENSIVYRDLKACLTTSYFHGRPFSGIWSPRSLSSEVAIEREPSSKRIIKRKAIKGENFLLGAEAPATKMPLSLRMLKRRQQKQTKTFGDTGSQVKPMGIGESFRKAFSSMIFILQTLQSHTLYICQYLFCEDMQAFVNMVHREMHLSFLCLFQQVFSCTPKFMLLVMLFLTDFTVFSIGSNVSLASVIPSTSHAVVSVCHELGNPQGHNVLNFLAQTEVNPQVPLKALSQSSTLSMGQVSPVDVDTGGTGDKGSKGLTMADGEDAYSSYKQYSDSCTMYSEDNSVSPDFYQNTGRTEAVRDQDLGDTSPSDNTMDNTEELHDLLCLWEEASDDPTSVARQIQNTTSPNLQTMQRLVAPISVRLEPDNYTCYDKTELIYQYTIIADSRNPMLLANYAQFLYLVRHDYNRAEEFFHRAMKADPIDAEVINRLATFLWLARGDRGAAERAYRAAILADPSNSYHAGSYAHFLWHSGKEDVAYPLRSIA